VTSGGEPSAGLLGGSWTPSAWTFRFPRQIVRVEWRTYQSPPSRSGSHDVEDGLSRVVTSSVTGVFCSIAAGLCGMLKEVQ
jgi:hypothetical protein